MRPTITIRKYLWPLLLGAALGVPQAYGAPTSGNHPWPQTAGGIGGQREFIVRLRPVDPITLADRVRTRSTMLLRAESPQKEQLRKAKFTGKDAVLVAIIPGGLLYAAYKHEKKRQLEQAIARADSERRELAHDLQVLAGAPANLLVAETTN